MASSTLDLYYDNTGHYVFNLASQSEKGPKWLYSTARPISQPLSVEIIRKVGIAAANANDHVLLRYTRTEPNAATGKFATYSVTVDISIPKDQSVLTSTVMTQGLGMVASLLNDSTAMAATAVNRGKLIGGLDI